MSRAADRPVSPLARSGFRCGTCGYGAVDRTAPHRCPRCGGTTWNEEGWKPYVSLVDELAADADDEDTSEPLQRELSELDSLGILPGVPFS